MGSGDSGKTKPRGSSRNKDGRVGPLPDPASLPPTAPYARISQQPPPLPKNARKRTPFPPIRDGTEKPVPVRGVSRRTPPPIPHLMQQETVEDEVTPPRGTPRPQPLAKVGGSSINQDSLRAADRAAHDQVRDRRELVWQDVAKYAPDEDYMRSHIVGEGASLGLGSIHVPKYPPREISVRPQANPSPIAKRLSSIWYSFMCLSPIKQVVISALFVLVVLGSATGIIVHSCLQEKKEEKVEQVAPQKEIKKEPSKIESKAAKPKPASFYIPKALRNPPMRQLPNKIPQRARNSLRA